MFGKQKLIQPLLRHLVKRYLCKAIRNEAAILSCFVIKSTFLQVTREIKFVDNGLYIISSENCVKENACIM